ncbi:hypothetical protein FRC04_011302 [Tulasnella sp. 424]|nr:hypothetical protein FRC04_011302 [Tulasnella sp. 424]KAG8971838.1 hypothetical protein FRC05_010799 [Tulasnella sp. 425]
MADDTNNPNAGRSLGGGPVEPPPESWLNRNTSGPRIGRVGGPSTGTARSTGTGRIATLSDMGGSSAPVRGRTSQRPPSDEDDEEDDTQEGERCGISVENPDRPARPGGLGTVRDILRKAAEGGPPPEPIAGHTGSRSFWGGGNVLGSDEVPSQFVPDPAVDSAESAGDQMETAVREITFWKTGFTIQDGPLMQYDDPANAEILRSINSGNAPPSILNVQVGQPVELRVSRRLNEDYVPSPKRFNVFEGQGNRLGSVLPGGAAPSASSQQPPGAFPSGGNASGAGQDRSSLTTRFEVDMNAPTTSVQIRLADGTRLVARMNLTHTVGDIRGFINASSPGQSSTPYTINTTFPNRVLDNDTLTIEQAKLQNSVIVQRRL